MPSDTPGEDKRFKAAIFDLDGTLADSLEDLANSMNDALERLDCPQHPLEPYKYMVGAGRRHLCSEALPSDRQDLLDRAETLMTEHYADHCLDNTKLYQGVPEMLQQLTDMGIPLAVLSNKPDNFVKLTVSKLMGRFCFVAAIGPSNRLPHKPAPDGALQIADMLSIAPEQFIYLGDTGTDMQTAVNAQMYPVGATWGFRKRDELLEAGAKALIDHPGELLQFFN